MSTIKRSSFNSEIIVNDISGLFGKLCCRRLVGERRSLSLGFGEKVIHGNKRLEDDFYGEWEIGSYSADWRIMRDDRILCGSRELVESISELDDQLKAIQLGRIISLSNPSIFDVRIIFDCGTSIDFINVSSDDDEIFHIFGPDKLYIEYYPLEGWEIGKSNEPLS